MTSIPEFATERDLQPDTDAAIDALKAHDADGPWTLTAIWPNGISGLQKGKPSIQTKSFGPDTTDQCAKWIKRLNGGCWNVYFPINPLKRPFKKKATKNDVAEARWLFVDLDPRMGEDLESERLRIRKLLTKKLPEGVPPPTTILESGNGFWGLWCLDPPLPVDGKDGPLTADVEARGRRLEMAFGCADDCRNIDRICRLPGSINYPDKRKLEKGRVPAMARVVKHVHDRIYSPDLFPPAASVVSKESTAKVEISGNLQKIDVDDLPVDDEIKVLIIYGTNPDVENYLDGDRSDIVWRVCCELVRAKVEDDTIAAVLLDKAYKISAHIFDQKNPKNYVARQIEKAGADVKPDKPSRDDIFKFIHESDAKRPKYGSACIARLVLADPTPIFKEQAYTEIKKRSKLSIESLRNQFQVEIIKHSGSDDIGLAVALRTLKDFYDDGTHLVRALDRSFWAFTGTHWKRTTDERVRHHILEIVEKRVDPKSGSFATVADAAFKLIIARQAANGDVLRFAEEPPPVINCKNGELWVDDKGGVGLRSHRPDSYLTYCLNVDWMPAAKCPKFDSALAEILPIENVRRHFLEMAGYVIQPRRPVASWWMFYGSGSNGKTALAATMLQLMGPDSHMSDRIDQLESSRFKIACLAGKLLFLDDDVDVETRLPDGLLKKISERKHMTGEFKGKDNFNFICVAAPLLLANRFPKSNDLSWGTRRRAHIIPFGELFLAPSDADKKAKQLGLTVGDAVEQGKFHHANVKLFEEIWSTEMAGILVRFVEGLERFMRRGSFEEPDACHESKRQWLAAAKPLAAFVQDVDLCDNGAQYSQGLSEFREIFFDWMDSEDMTHRPAGNTIKRNLEELDYRVAKSDGENRVYGLRAKSFPKERQSEML